MICFKSPKYANIYWTQNYEEPDEGRQMVQDLLEIIQKAMTSDLGLVSIGD